MGMILECDICGKRESNTVRFSLEPLLLNIRNHEDNRYLVHCNIAVEDVRDTELWNKVDNASTAEEVGKIKTLMVKPSPIICNNCKKELVKLSISYGKTGGSLSLSDVPRI